MNLIDLPVVFVDCQTTGANPKRGRLLEVAWRAGDTPTVSRLVRLPEGESVPRRIQILTGISDEDLAEARAREDVREELRAAFSGARVAIAHYAQFERPFLDDLFEGAFPSAWLCTHRIAKAILPGLPAKGVRGLAGYFGDPIAHELKRAACHVEATAQIWRGLISVLAKEGVATFEALERRLRAKPRKQKAAYEYPMDRAKRLAFPDVPGVYRMLAKNGQVLYVGKATSLKSRVNSYFRGQKKRDGRKLEMLSQAWDIQTTECATPLEAALLENDEIKRLDPPYNVSLKAGFRALAYYSRDFDSVSTEKDERHPTGPFPGARALEPALTLAHSLRLGGPIDERVFWDPVEPALIDEGFAIYCAQERLKSSDLSRPRSALAQGLREFRRYARAQRLAAALESPEPESDADDAEITADDVADKFRKLLRRAGHSLALAKGISHVSAARVRYRDGAVASAIEPRATAAFDVRSYDRARILLTELARVRASGGAVHVEPPLRVPLI